jgi:hypothetical protein
MKKLLSTVIVSAILFTGCMDGPVGPSGPSAGDGFALSLSEVGLLSETPPIVEITAPADGDRFEYDFLDPSANQRTVSVTVTRALSEGSGSNAGLCGLHTLRVTVNDELIGSEATGASQSLGVMSSPPQPTCQTSTRGFNFDWDFDQSGVGFYVIRASVIQQTGGSEHSDDIEVEVYSQEIVIVDHPAAPAVAASLLKAAGIQPRYGSGRTGGNHIADVAARMGPRTDFDGVSKDDVEAYRCAVSEYLATKSNPAVGVATCNSVS